MKSRLFFAAAAVAGMALTSCSSSISSTDVSNTVTSGTWRITYFWDSDHEETSNYNGFNFTFATGTVTITDGSTTVNGAWNTSTSDDHTHFTLVLPTTGIWDDLNDDWHVIERTDTKIRLEDVSGGGSGTDYLTFEKN